jgi:hypothetical protein
MKKREAHSEFPFLVKFLSSTHNRKNMPKRRMPLGLQKYTILKIFKKLNPNAEPDNLDWDNLDNLCNFRENYDNMAKTHPDFEWEDTAVAIGRMEDEIRNRQIEEKEEERESLLASGRVEEAAAVKREIEALERAPDFIKKGWSVDNTEDGQYYTTVVKIKSRSQGKKYNYGRIQISTPQSLIGLDARITVFKPNVSENERKKPDLNERDKELDGLFDEYFKQE